MNLIFEKKVISRDKWPANPYKIFALFIYKDVENANRGTNRHFLIEVEAKEKEAKVSGEVCGMSRRHADANCVYMCPSERVKSGK